MNGAKTLWIILTPVYKPASAGGAIYTDLLARALAERGHDVEIFTEHYDGKPRHETIRLSNASIRLHRVFPIRASRTRKDLGFYLTFLFENLIYFALPLLYWRAIRRHQPNRVRLLFHCSYFYKVNALPLLLSWIRRIAFQAMPSGMNGKMILDVRDNYFPRSKSSLLESFDAIICSAISNTKLMKSLAPKSIRVVHAPMPFEHVERPSKKDVAATLERFELRDVPYVLNANGIAYRKHYVAMREAIALLRRQPGMEDVVLVTAGRERDRRRVDTAAEERGECRYLGIVDHASLHALMQAAICSLVLFEEEAISRSALEAMSAGGRVILPNIEEFRTACPDSVLSRVSPENIAQKILSIRHRPIPDFNYAPYNLSRSIHLYEDI